jgi:uncharacterized protein YhjY with autotransporter beta-barrel domain
LSHDTVIGVALAGGDTNWGLADGLGSGRSNALQVGLYGKTRSGPAYLAGSLAYTWHAVGTDRLVLGGDQLSARFNAESFGGRLEGGYRLAWPVAAVTPYAAVQAQSFSTPAYSETDVGGGGFGLAFAARTATDTRSELGTRFERVVAVAPTSTLALKARLAWAHDWVSDPTLAATFQTLPGASFTVNGAAPARDSALATAGAELRLLNGVSARQARRRVREPRQHLCGHRRHSLRLVKRHRGFERLTRPPRASSPANPESSTRLAAQPDHHVDARDLVALGRDRRLADENIGVRNIEQRVVLLDEEMVMLGRIGVEIALRAFDRDLAQQPRIGELVERIVDGRQRHRRLGVVGLLVQHLGRDVPVAFAEQQPAELHALTGGSQPHLPQHRLDVMPRAAGERGTSRLYRRVFGRGCRSPEDQGAR